MKDSQCSKKRPRPNDNTEEVIEESYLNLKKALNDCQELCEEFYYNAGKFEEYKTSNLTLIARCQIRTIITVDAWKELQQVLLEAIEQSPVLKEQFTRFEFMSKGKKLHPHHVM